MTLFKIFIMIPLVSSLFSCSNRIEVDFRKKTALATNIEAAVDPVPNPFVSEWATTGSNETITLPLKTGYNYNFTVVWGDGTPVETITSFNQAEATHTYATAGSHTVTMTGLLEAWSFNDGGDKLKIISVTDFGDLGWIDLGGAFHGCSNLTAFAGGNTAAVTDMSHMFQGATSLTSLDLSSFNTAAVTTMYRMFNDASSLISLDLSSFDTAKVTNMSAMFFNASGLTGLDLFHFDTAAVTNMSSMFLNASGLTSLDLSSFDTAAVIDMQYMFSGASGLTSLDLTFFDTVLVMNMSSMFRGVTLTSLDLSSFDTGAVTNMDNMFKAANSLTSLDATGWQDVTTNPVTGVNIFLGTNAGLMVICDQGGSPGMGDLFGEPCMGGIPTFF